MDNRAAFLRQVGFCSALSDETIGALAAIASLLQRPTDTMIQIEGDPAEAMYIVVSGHVKIARLAPTGREQIMNVIKPGQHFNTVPIFDDGPCPANAEALTDVTLLVLPRDDLRHVVEQHPALALALLKEFTARLRHLVNLVMVGRTLKTFEALGLIQARGYHAARSGGSGDAEGRPFIWRQKILILLPPGSTCPTFLSAHSSLLPLGLVSRSS